jgi:oligoribonuclease
MLLGWSLSFARIRGQRPNGTGSRLVTTRSENLIWIDLEMTGLDPDRDRIIEIATIVTDSQLELVAEGPVIAIHQSDAVLHAMDEWNRTTHGASGLLERVRSSAVAAAQAEELTLEFLRVHAEPGASPMCGNSICQDRRFLYREMPRLERFFHYRNLDVSTLKELARRWAPEVLAGMTKESRHLALDDVRESIRELGYYRKTMFIETP